MALPRVVGDELRLYLVGPETALDHEYRLGVVNFEDRHPVDGARLVIQCGWIHHIIRSYHQYHICIREFRIDVFHFYQFIISYARFSQK